MKRPETDLLMHEDDVPTPATRWLAEHGRAFDWLIDGADLYTVNDLRVRYR